ncbi:MAG: DNA mismatch repair protein MutS, partial [Gammaproteobacteria bacterium]
FNVQQVLRAAADMAAVLADRPDLFPGDRDILRAPPALIGLLDRSIEGGGHLRADASPELEALYGQCTALRRDAESIVLQRMQRQDVREHLKNPEKVVWHSDRAVLVIHERLADRVRGVRRGSAMGGRDAVVEPMEAVQANNRLETVTGRLNAEQQRVLRSITAELRTHHVALEELIAALTWIDLALAAGRLSATMNAHAPKLVEERLVELNEAYHPLLLLQFADGTLGRPVPLSVRLDSSRRLMLISGPNTGGKTVALKTVGLLVAMAHCGLHIPAEGDCVIGHYRRVMVDVGDRQSLFHHLSTFAGHVEVLKRILLEADASTLVLLDELGTGTDPEEGAALAMAVLDELSERQVQGIVNTHLPPLKAYAAGRPHLLNASMRFDHERLRPTYVLQVGVPGQSLGLVVAEQNGLEPTLIERARRHLQHITQGREGGH